MSKSPNTNSNLSHREAFDTGMKLYNDEKYEEAFAYFKSAARPNEGNEINKDIQGEAYNYLGIMTKRGLGTDQNIEKALNYFACGDILGNLSARLNRERLEPIVRANTPRTVFQVAVAMPIGLGQNVQNQDNQH